MDRTVAMPLQERRDDELVALTRRGDERAFAELYERYFHGVYDFALRMLRDPDAAADVVQSTFVKAWASLRGPKEVDSIKAWLYAVARNLAIDELRRRKRLAAPRADADEDPIFTLVDEHRLADPHVAAHDAELAELVWESAAALSPQEYSLLDLHLRQGLDADELASTLGLAKGAVYTRLTRLRDSLDEAVTSSLLMRRGRRECLELDALLTELGATRITRDVRRAVTKHVDECERCQESKRRWVTPAELFAGLTLVPLPEGLAGAVWERIASQLGFGLAGGGADGGAATQNGHGGLSAGTKAKALTALGTLGAVAVVGALLFPRGGVEDPGDVHSTSHPVGTPTRTSVVRMAWTRQADADAFSVTWSRAPSTLPDEVADLPGDATSATSRALAAGRWWFHLRTRGDRDWTHTVHVGPFVIVADPSTPERKQETSNRPPGPAGAAASTPTPSVRATIAAAIASPTPATRRREVAAARKRTQSPRSIGEPASGSLPLAAPTATPHPPLPPLPPPDPPPEPPPGGPAPAPAPPEAPQPPSGPDTSATPPASETTPTDTSPRPGEPEDPTESPPTPSEPPMSEEGPRELPGEPDPTAVRPPRPSAERAAA